MSLAVPVMCQISAWSRRADTAMSLQPKQPGKPFALEEIIIVGFLDERNLALKLHCAIGNTAFIFCPPPVGTHRLGLWNAFRGNSEWKHWLASSEPCEIPLPPTHGSPGNHLVCSISTGT